MVGIIIVIVLFVLVVYAYLFLRGPRFGQAPSGRRLQKIEGSPNYKNGQFQNLNNTPQLAEGESYLGVMRKFFFGKSKRAMPAEALPSKKVDLFKRSGIPPTIFSKREKGSWLTRC
jgi:hypothetical protein